MHNHSKRQNILTGKLPAIFAVLLFVTGLFSTTNAQSDCRYSLVPCGYTISGRVMDACGDALPGITVGIKPLGGEFTRSTTTDAQGNYSFDNLPAGGNYVVVPKVSGLPSGGFVTPDSTFINLSTNQTADFYYRRMTMYSSCQPPIVYASDLRFSEIYNQFTQTHQDENILGSLITLNGVVYHKGLGVHSDSEVTFQVAGQYTSFVADIGLDDATQWRGLVRFTVVADDVVIYDSGQMTGDSLTKTVNVNVAGAKIVKLKVSKEGDFDSDHADWANARFVR